MSTDDEEAAVWRCAGCDHKYVGVLDVQRPIELRANVRIAKVCVKPVAIEPVSAEMAEMAESLATSAGAERRRADRTPTAIDVQARPLFEDYQVAGGAFRAVLHDISTTGAALLHKKYVHEGLLLLHIAPNTKTAVTLVLEITRSRQLESHYETAGRFVARLDS